MIDIYDIPEMIDSYFTTCMSSIGFSEITLMDITRIFFLVSAYITTLKDLIRKYNNFKNATNAKAPTTFYVKQSIVKYIYGKYYDSILLGAHKTVESQQNINIADTEEFHRCLNFRSNKKIVLRRDHLLNNSCIQLKSISAQTFTRREIYIIFEKEAGIDDGGLSREWVNLFIKQMVSPSSKYFILANEKENTVIPHMKHSTSVDYHLEMYQLLGRVLAYCIILEITLDTKIDFIVFKQLLNKECSIEDLKDIDPLLTESLLSVKNNSKLLYFENDEGEELVSGGCSILVNYENFDEYMYLYLKDKFFDKTRFAVDLIRAGFFEVLPESIFIDFEA